MTAALDNHPLPLAPAGAMLGLPVQAGQARQVLLTCGGVQHSAAPRPDADSFYAPDFFLDDPQPWIVPADDSGAAGTCLLPAADVQARFAALAVGVPPAQSLLWTPPLLDKFAQSFAQLQELFQSGALAKAVPVVFEQAQSEATPARTTQLLKAVLSAVGVLVPYGVWHEDGGMAGASPELLFEVRDGVLRTMALAGTLAAPAPGDTADAERRFLQDPKERREHVLVIEGIQAALAAFGAARVADTRVLKLPGLWHLQTPIEIDLRGTPSFEALARALHPTPALGGSPQRAAVDWLRRQDAQDNAPLGRGRFGAPFGVQRPGGHMVCLVAVRSLLWNSAALRIGAGCGVIKESVLEREWEELRRKRETVKALLG